MDGPTKAVTKDRPAGGSEGRHPPAWPRGNHQGLRPGDVVVLTARHQRVQRDGMPVRVVDMARQRWRPTATGAPGAPDGQRVLPVRQAHRALARCRCRRGPAPVRPLLRAAMPPSCRQHAWPAQPIAATASDETRAGPPGLMERHLCNLLISVRRPVFATVLSLLVLLIGAVTRPSVREYPKIDEPVVTVSVRYVGRSAEVIESQVASRWKTHRRDRRGGRDDIHQPGPRRPDQRALPARKTPTTPPPGARPARACRNRLPCQDRQPVIAKGPGPMPSR